MKFNSVLNKYSAEEIESEKIFMESVANGDSDSMILAAANVAAWSMALVKGLNKRLGKDTKHVSPFFDKKTMM